MEFINVRKRFGDHWKIVSERPNCSDRWLDIVLCRYGHLYLHGGDYLGVATNKHGQIARRIAELDVVTVVQDGDDGINAVFHVDDVAAVAQIVRPKLSANWVQS